MPTQAWAWHPDATLLTYFYADEFHQLAIAVCQGLCDGLRWILDEGLLE